MSVVRYAHDSLGVDFSKYDCDNDALIDFVFAIYAGYGENYGADSTTIWPCSQDLEMNPSFFLYVGMENS
jgi:hypothetical protein